METMVSSTDLESKGIKKDAYEGLVSWNGNSLPTILLIISKKLALLEWGSSGTRGPVLVRYDLLPTIEGAASILPFIEAGDVAKGMIITNLSGANDIKIITAHKRTDNRNEERFPHEKEFTEYILLPRTQVILRSVAIDMYSIRYLGGINLDGNY
jgi:hypothetical protein